MSDFPPAMRDRRHQMTYDYVGVLTLNKQFAKAFETCDAINPPTARNAAEARELRFESLANLRGCLERENTYHATQDPSNLELAVAVSRELLKLRDGALEHLNLGASLCIKGDLEEGVRHYEIAAGKQDEPESRGGSTRRRRSVCARTSRTDARSWPGTCRVKADSRRRRSSPARLCR